MGGLSCDLINFLTWQSAESWTAIWTGALFVATASLAAIAWIQIAAARRENRLTQTLIACGLYDTSSVIFECCRTLTKAKDSGELQLDPGRFKLEILTVLNFLDGIAIGVSQKMYVKDLVKDHMSAIMARQVADLLSESVGPKVDCSPEHFTNLVALNNEWSSGHKRPHFEEPLEKAAQPD